MRKPKKQNKPLNDLSRCLTPFDPNRSLVTLIELSKESWLVVGIVPGVERQPLKKLTADETGLLKLLERWRAEAEKAGHKIDRMTVAFEVGRDGFWLTRWLRARGIESHVIHAASVAVAREHRRAKTDRLDTEQLKRALCRPALATSARMDGCHGSVRHSVRRAYSGNGKTMKTTHSTARPMIALARTYAVRLRASGASPCDLGA
jgi:hypothetical protein